MTAGETYIVCFVGVALLLALGLWLETRLAVPELEAEIVAAESAEQTAFDLFRERRAGIDRTRAEIQALPELGERCVMNAEEALVDLAERLAEANTRLLGLAETARNTSLSTTFTGERISVEASRLEAKAEGVRLALSYVNEAAR